VLEVFNVTELSSFTYLLTYLLTYVQIVLTCAGLRLMDRKLMHCRFLLQSSLR